MAVAGSWATSCLTVVRSNPKHCWSYPWKPSPHLRYAFLGKYGMFVGNQQFTVRNVSFNNIQSAVFQNWNWGWTFQGITINNCQVHSYTCILADLCLIYFTSTKDWVWSNDRYVCGQHASWIYAKLIIVPHRWTNISKPGLLNLLWCHRGTHKPVF